MQSFRTEIENPIVEKDIIELEKKIHLYQKGKLDEDSFRSLRLARGVYGQRQTGVQMVRIKLPLGIITPAQLRRIAEVSDEYSNGNLHITTRQDIQIHYVSLDATPQLWSELEKDEITIREACGNTVRNITSSPYAGIDKNEPFDVTDHGWTLFEFLLRNPIGQEMGRKFKISLSSSDADQSRSYMHDFGLIPKVEYGIKGFKVLFGGGLGAQPVLASVINEFLPEDQLFRYAEAVLKVFDKYGERNKRNKARLKFLVQQEGIDLLIEKIEIEYNKIDTYVTEIKGPTKYVNFVNENPSIPDDIESFKKWKLSNVRDQKQEGYSSVLLRVKRGNLTSNQARQLADVFEKFSSDSGRLTIEQNVLFRFIPNELLGNLYGELAFIGLADAGANTIADITSCPGTETCNLGITASYSVADLLEDLLEKEYEDVINSGDISIKISGCMNSCGQHSVSDIGFHGSTIRNSGFIYPALQVLLGGANLGDGNAQFADKVIKVPSKRIENVVRIILDDYKLNRSNEVFNTYYNRKGKLYFYDLLKDVAEIKEVIEDELLDWGASDKFKPEIGIGECAGVKIDLVQTLLYESYEKIEESKYYLESLQYKDAAYSAYSSFIQSAKAFLLKEGKKTNSKIQIEESFEEFYPAIEENFRANSFSDLLETAEDIEIYVEDAERFHGLIEKINNAKNGN
jgi:sulfite reductase (ferredoxin)